VTKPTEAGTTPETTDPKPTSTVRAPDPAVTAPTPPAPAPAGTIATAPSAAPVTRPSTDVNVSDLDTNAAPSLSSEDTRRVQIALKGRGFDPGPIDGVLNPQTQQALQKFQSTYGIDPRGVVDSQTLLALGEAELASRAK
jgi:peptidoglycan hydrolase-like protein with peptidoglycan-binding domain